MTVLYPKNEKPKPIPKAAAKAAPKPAPKGKHVTSFKMRGEVRHQEHAEFCLHVV